MSRDPFDRFRKMEKLIQKLLRGASSGVLIRKSSSKTRIDIQGNVPDSVINGLKRKYPNAEISIGAKKERALRPPVSWLRGRRKSREEKRRAEETDPEELALRRFKEKRKEKRRKGSASEEGENG